MVCMFVPNLGTPNNGSVYATQATQHHAIICRPPSGEHGLFRWMNSPHTKLMKGSEAFTLWVYRIRLLLSCRCWGKSIHQARQQRHLWMADTCSLQMLPTIPITDHWWMQPHLPMKPLEVLPIDSKSAEDIRWWKSGFNPALGHMWEHCWELCSTGLQSKDDSFIPVSPSFA